MHEISARDSFLEWRLNEEKTVDFVQIKLADLFQTELAKISIFVFWVKWGKEKFFNFILDSICTRIIISVRRQPYPVRGELLASEIC